MLVADMKKSLEKIKKCTSLLKVLHRLIQNGGKIAKLRGQGLNCISLNYCQTAYKNMILVGKFRKLNNKALYLINDFKTLLHWLRCNSFLLIFWPLLKCQVMNSFFLILLLLIVMKYCQQNFLNFPTKIMFL